MNKANRAIVRNKGKGGIEWYRYQNVILKPKLISFALGCMTGLQHMLLNTRILYFQLLELHACSGVVIA